MAAPIVWQPTRDDLATAAAAFSADDSRAVAAFGVLAALQGAGDFYDGRNTDALRTRIAMEDSEYASRLFGWRAVTGALHTLTDRIARWLEGRALDAATGREVQPRVATLPDGTRFPLTPEDTTALAIPDGYDTEDEATAFLVLATTGGSPVPIVRVTARDAGRAGDRLEVSVDDDPAYADRFTLRVRLGGYEERWESLDFTQAHDATDTSSSFLVGEVKQVGLGRPATAGWAAMDGGGARVQEALDERVARALLLGSTGAVQQLVMATAQRQFRDAWAGKPPRPSDLAGTASHQLVNLESSLQGALAAAAAMIDALSALP